MTQSPSPGGKGKASSHVHLPVKLSNSRKYGFAFSRRVFARRLRQLRPLLEKRAQGKPGADCTHGSRAKKARGRTTGVTGNIPAFPARWFTTYFVLPVTGLCCHRRLRELVRPNLAPASGRQDHTTSPSAMICARLSQAIASTASHRAFVTLRNAPLVG
jgi:hypothetical protein